MNELLSRFYALPVEDRFAEAITEQLTNAEEPDLVVAHLSRNWAYFGAIDKTLTGFVILESEGDNYTLLDLRGGGQVYWQDHETRAVELRFASFDDFLAFQRRKEAGEDEDSLLAELRPAAPTSTRVPSSAQLLARNQWAVHGLAQYMIHQGKPMSGAVELASNGAGHLNHVWPDEARVEAAFARELGQLPGDVHLALSWLLHASLRAEADRLAAIGEAMTDCQVELWRAFWAAFGSAAPTLDVKVVPDFRARRSFFVMATAFGKREPDARRLMLALELDGVNRGDLKVLHLEAALASGALADAELAPVVTRLDPSLASTAYLQTVLEVRAGATPSAAAGRFLRALPTAGFSWAGAFKLATTVHAAVAPADVDALVAAIDFLRPGDAHHRHLLAMQLAAQRLAGREVWAPRAELEAQLLVAEQAAAPLAAVAEKGANVTAILSSIADRAVARVVARRVLMRLGTAQLPDEAVRWAFDSVAHGDDGDRVSLLTQAFGKAPDALQKRLLNDLDPVEDASSPSVEVMLGLLAACTVPTTAGAGDEFVQELNVSKRAEGLLDALAPVLAEPAVFDRLVQIAATSQDRYPTETIAHELFYPSDKPRCITAKLSEAQAVRAVELLLAHHAHPNIHVRNSAGHTLYRFSPAGAEAALVRGLQEAGARLANGDDPKINHERVDNLYAAVRGLGTPTSRQALVQRLFDERGAYWRLGNALGGLFTPELHHLILERLSQARDAHAAAAYAATLLTFVKRAPLRVQLATLVCEWPRQQGEAGRMQRYVLEDGVAAALELKAYPRVRALWDATRQLPGPALSPYDEVDRKAPTPQPFADGGAQRAALDDVLAGGPEQRKAELEARGAAARASSTPWREVDDVTLGTLAGAEVRQRLFHDTELGTIAFLDGERALHWFDGYGVVPPPCTGVEVGKGTPPKGFLVGAAGLSQRAMTWEATEAASFAEALRFGAQVLLTWGPNNSAPDAYGLRFADEVSAQRFVDRWAANPAPGSRLADPFYLPGRGAVVREYGVPGANGPAARPSLALVDRALNGEAPLASEVAAVTAHQARETTLLRDQGAMLRCVEWVARLRREEDQTLVEWLGKRARSDARPLRWHLDAAADTHRQLERQGLLALLPSFEVTSTGPSTEADLAAFQQGRTHHLPDALRALWLERGGAGFTIDGVGMRFLSAREALEARPGLRARALASIVEQGPEALAQVERLDALVVTSAGEPVLLLLDDARQDGRVFAQAKGAFLDLRWGNALAWELASTLNSSLLERLLERAPSLRLYWFDQAHRAADVVHRRFEDPGASGAPTRLEVRFDRAARVVGALVGKPGTPGQATVTRYATPEEAEAAYQALIAQRTGQGFVELPLG